MYRRNVRAVENEKGWGKTLSLCGKRGGRCAIVGHLNLDWSGHGVGGREDVQLRGADIVQERGFAVDRRGDAVELSRQLILDEVRGHPGAGGEGQATSLDLDPRVRRDGGSFALRVGHQRNRGRDELEVGL